MYIWLLHNLVGNKWIYSLSCANIGKDFDIVKEYTIIFKKETYVVEVQAYNEMGETKWTPVIEDEIAHPLFFNSVDKSQRRFYFGGTVARDPLPYGSPSASTIALTCGGE